MRLVLADCLRLHRGHENIAMPSERTGEPYFKCGAAVIWWQEPARSRTIRQALIPAELNAKLTADGPAGGLVSKPFDGRDVLDVLQARRGQLDRELYFYHGQAGEQREKSAIRTARWKLIIHGPNIMGGEWQSAKHERFLFRIDRDPNETTNLLAAHPGVATQLATKLIAHRRLQPKISVEVYGAGRKAFTAPDNWIIR